VLPTPRRPVLFVDDDHDIRVTTRDWLEAHGFVVVTAATGVQALEILATSTKPFLMIVDIQMPIMGGWELLDRVKANPTLADIPVIVISANDTRTDHRLAAKLMKPADPQRLLEIVANHAATGTMPRGSSPVLSITPELEKEPDGDK
jgi:CheY-like chemotaxis protein